MGLIKYPVNPVYLVKFYAVRFTNYFMPHPEEEKLTPLDRGALEAEVEISTFRGSGPGGQHRNKTESAVRLRHAPTGITVVASEHRSQWRNREAAWERLIERLERKRHKPKPRIKTRMSAAAKRARLDEKKKVAAKKQRRAKPAVED